MNKLDGQVAIVTGAARGLGRAFALRLAKLGALVGVIDINMRSYDQFPLDAAKGVPTDEEIRSWGGRAYAIEADVSDIDSVTAAVTHITRELGRTPTIAICNAGGGTGTLHENFASTVDVEALHMVIQRNLFGTIHTVQAVAPQMKAIKYGKIVTVGSISGVSPLLSGGYSHYGSTKAAVIMYTKYLAKELGPYGITVNCLVPGWIKTGKSASLFESSDLATQIEAEVALRRLGTPQDCANVIEFLTTDLSSYITGEVISVSGGYGL